MAEESFVEGTLGKWKLLSEIDTGGNSVVSLVEAPTETGLPYSAVKLFTEAVKTGDRKARFIAEIQTVKKLGNLKGCATLLDHGYFEDRPFYVMPYFKGGSLHEKYINRRTKEFDPVASLEQFLKIVENVKTLHSRTPALAVRDIKPKNILFDGAEPVICDFGLALWANTPTEDRPTKQAATDRLSGILFTQSRIKQQEIFGRSGGRYGLYAPEKIPLQTMRQPLETNTICRTLFQIGKSQMRSKE
jgi:serine/threonine protein kinase